MAFTSFQFLVFIFLCWTSFAAVQGKCTTTCSRLLSKKVWRRERGYWIGNYTLLGGDGKPFKSAGWPYRYDTYFGFIRIMIDGPCLFQRNVFLYPPLRKSVCPSRAPGSVVGNGKCGRNGNEKVFEAAQNASDCEGNLAGPSFIGGSPLDTTTNVQVGNDDTVLYQVRLPEEAGGSLLQSQQTVIMDGTRVRSAIGLIPGTATATFVSFYRERRVSKAQWLRKLYQTRKRLNILEEDYCGWDPENQRSNKTCDEHFAIPRCPVRASSPTCVKKRKLYRQWKRKADRCVNKH